MLIRFAGALAIAAAVTAATAAAPDSALTADVNARIRQEAAAHSQLLTSLHMLTDVYGPRLTGSPNARAAGEWALKTMTSWGLSNAHLEPWEFGHAGWANERVSAAIVSPVKAPLSVQVLAWTPSTTGTVTAPVTLLAIPERPTSFQLTDYLEGMRGQVRNRIVLAGTPARVPVLPRQTPSPRFDDERLRQRYGPDAPSTPQRGARDGQPAPMTAVEISRRIDQFLIESGALVRINDARREMGQIAVSYNASYDLTHALPTLIMRNEDYGRIARIIGDGTTVQLEVAIVNRSYPDGKTAYNAIADLAGGDLRDQVVMIGGHLDSWHAATGATDNAIGCAVMMEAVRILKALGLAPRRTIRVALWTGEEQGLLGSQAYVREHFGRFEAPKAEFNTLSAYLNLDTGTGRIRGARVFGPKQTVADVAAMLAPFSDLGVVGVAALERRTLGGTDSTVFNGAGLPSVNFDQDPIQYDTNTHHTNLDTYERILEDDVRQAAIVVAGLAYQLAMRDEPLARFDVKTMAATTWK